MNGTTMEGVPAEGMSAEGTSAEGASRWRRAEDEVKAGRLEAAAALYAGLWTEQPDDPAPWLAAARVAFSLKRMADAVAFLERAHRLAPSDGKIRRNLLLVLAEKGDAARVLEVAAAAPVPPFDAYEMNALGAAHRRRGDPARAEDCLRQAMRLDPKYVPPIVNLANLLDGAGRTTDAAALVGTLLDLPDVSPEVLRRAAFIDIKAGNAARGTATALRIADRLPNTVEYLMSLGVQLYDRWHYREALELWTAAAARDPRSPHPLTNMASALRQLKRLDECERVLRKVLETSPDNLAALNALGNLLIQLGRAADAMPPLRRTLEIDPGFVLGKANLIRALIDEKQIDEAAALARGMLDAPNLENEQFLAVFGVLRRTCDFDNVTGRNFWPFFIDAAKRGRFGGMFDLLPMVGSDTDAEALYQVNGLWAATMRGVARNDPLPPRDPDLVSPRPARSRKLRVGILSSDLRRHVVSMFVSPVFKHYDRSKYEIFCYSPFKGPPDSVEKLVASRVDRFTRVDGQDAAEIARMIREDDVDALFELNGFTRYSQTGVVAWRPARTHISYLGYPFSTALDEMDWMLVDRHIRPVDNLFMAEKPLELRGPYYCFGSRAEHGMGFDDHAIDREPHCVRTGHITFGIFNNPLKYTPRGIAVWARILHAVPGSTIKFVRPEGGAAALQANLRHAFARHDIAPERVEFEVNPPGAHTFWYNRVDICLDTFPQTGGTTTCESLWMGVPTVSLHGDRVLTRLGLSILSWAGLGDLCHRDVEGYVACAVALAGDIDRLRDLRRTLRDRILSSPLGDEQSFTRDFLEAAEHAIEVRI